MGPGPLLRSFVLLKIFQMNNKSKIALVTGGSRGLGRDMALRLAEKGLDVILTYNNRAEDAQRVVAQIEAAGRKARSEEHTSELQSP